MTGESLQQDEELDALRGELLRFVIDELGKRIGTPDDTRLPEVLARAIDAEVARAFERHLAIADLPDPRVFRDELFDAARLGAESQAARDKQLEAIAKRLVVVAQGVAELLGQSGIAYDPHRDPSEEELAGLKLDDVWADPDRADRRGEKPDVIGSLVRWGIGFVTALSLLASGAALALFFVSNTGRQARPITTVQPTPNVQPSSSSSPSESPTQNPSVSASHAPPSD